ncbi:hypothetical protein ABBQ32_010392 [Trebouxia sp. C0010 RCD-2024]
MLAPALTGCPVLAPTPQSQAVARLDTQGLCFGRVLSGQRGRYISSGQDMQVGTVAHPLGLEGQQQVPVIFRARLEQVQQGVPLG